MAPKRAQAASYSHTLPSANLSHPSSSFLPGALAAGRPHPPTYHTFISSPFYPSTASTKGKKAAPALPSLAANPIPVKVVQQKVLKWYDGVKEGRGMPWRKEVVIGELSTTQKTQRGYEVWIMLQQTQVVTVIGYFERWMQTFPTLASLAVADIEAVNAVWAGLGYYSRASRLLAGAKTVMRDFKGIMPQTAVDLEKIDGIGPYSAGAISSIAFSKRAAMVDGNVTRVLSRLTAHHAPPTAKATTSFIWALADTLVPAPDSSISSGGPNKPGSWNQGLMELGATVCTPKNPNCGECPLSDECLAYAEVRAFKSRKTLAPLVDLEDLCELCEPVNIDADYAVTQYPMAKEKKKLREEETAVCVLEWEPSGGGGAAAAKGKRKVLLVKRPEKGLLAGLFEFPAVDLPPSADDSTPSFRRAQLSSLLSTLLTSPLPPLKPSPTPSSSSSTISILSTTDLGAITQVYSHQTRLYHILRVVLSSPSPPSLSTSSSTTPDKSLQSLAGRAKWIDEADVKGSNIGGAVGKVWEVRQSGKSGLGKLSGKPRGGDGNAKKAVGAGAGKRAKVVEKRTKEDDDFLAESDEEIEIERSPRRRKKVVVVEVAKEESPPPPVYAPRKKPRIVISDDDDEE
ncbi:hypothetical protein RQP46_010312 [Phenoliferia psychrophenolica]